MRLRVPGRHNASNALAAIAADPRARRPDRGCGRTRSPGSKGSSAGWRPSARPRGVTVIDDFAHNPDKIDATLATLRAHPGRLLIMFQPHGYGPLAKMGEELADSFADGMAPDDRLYLPDPVYQGGTVEQDARLRLAGRCRSRERGGEAEHIPERAEIGDALVGRGEAPATASSIMGARDDTLIDFARELVEKRLRATLGPLDRRSAAASQVR